MIKRSRFPKIFFGWWTVLASGILSLWGFGYYTVGMAALFKPIASELGLSRAATSVAASIGRFEGGFEAPLTGWITDRFGPRWIILLGTFLIGLGLILMNFINSLWGYYLVWGVIIATGVNIGLSLPLDKAISNWFVKKRGIALSVRWVFRACHRSGVATNYLAHHHAGLADDLRGGWNSNVAGRTAPGLVPRETAAAGVLRITP